MLNAFLSRTATLLDLPFGPNAARADNDLHPDESDSPRSHEEDRGSFADWLPYDAWDDESEVFINLDSIGFCLEVAPQTGADQQMASLLQGLFKGLRKDTCIQIHMFPSPHILEQLKQFAEIRVEDDDADKKLIARGRRARNDNIFRFMARRRVEHLLKGAHQSLADGMHVLVRDFRCVVSVTVAGSIDDKSQLDYLVSLRESISNSLRSADFPNWSWTPDDLINWCADLLNPNRLLDNPKPLAYDPGRRLRFQIIERDTHSDTYYPDRIQLRKPGKPQYDVDVRMFSASTYPTPFTLAGMSTLLGDFFAPTIQYSSPFLLTLGVFVPDNQAVKAEIGTHTIKTDREAKSDLAQLSSSFSAKRKDLQKVNDAIARGEKMMEIYHQVAVFAPPDRLNEAERCARSVWEARNFGLNIDSTQQRQALQASLPMRLDREFFKDVRKLQRFSTKPSGNVINLAPLVAEWKGTGTPRMLFVGRRGQLMSFDEYDETIGNKNVAIAGASGSGKSVLLNEMAYSHYASGSLLWIFDKGRSFEKLCAKVKGQLIRFTEYDKVNINPFSMVNKIEDDMAMLQPVLAKMASAHHRLDSTQYAALAVAAQAVFKQYGNEAAITPLRDMFKSGTLPNFDLDSPGIEDSLKRLAIMLTPYCRGEVYGDLMEGPNTINFDKRFIVLDTNGLKDKPDIHRVVQMISVFKVSRSFLSNRNERKKFIMDEAKSTLSDESDSDDPVMNQFVGDLYEQARKWGTSATTATQGIDHYYASKAAESCLNNSSFILMLRQSKEAIESISRTGRIVMNENMKRTLMSLRTEEGAFSEVYLHTQELGSGVGRLVIDPHSLLMYSNRQEDNVPLDKYQAAGMSIDEAISQLLHDRGVTT
jgi:conjugal transfer ATP-binding protein TraC